MGNPRDYNISEVPGEGGMAMAISLAISQVKPQELLVDRSVLRSNREVKIKQESKWLNMQEIVIHSDMAT